MMGIGPMWGITIKLRKREKSKIKNALPEILSHHVAFEYYPPVYLSHN